MFNDLDDGQTQYCPMCLEWANKYEKLKEENDTLHISIEKLKGDLYIAEDSLRDFQEHYYKLKEEERKQIKEILK